MRRWISGFTKMKSKATVLVKQSGRTADAEWPSVRSWYGGHPRFSQSIDWPTSDDGTPLHFIAQLNLEEIAAISPDLGVPKHGSLLFFLDTALSSRRPTKHAIWDEFHWPCAILYTQDTHWEDRQPPSTLPPLFGQDWNYYFRGADPENVPRTFGRLAVEFQEFQSSSANFSEDLKKQVLSKNVFHANLNGVEPPISPAQILWRVVDVIINNCTKAVTSREYSLTDGYFAGKKETPGKLDTLRKTRPAIEETLEKWRTHIQSHGSNEPIGELNGSDFMDDLDELKQQFLLCEVTPYFVGKVNNRPGIGGHMDVPYYWYHGRATNEAYCQMITGSDEDYAALPKKVKQGFTRIRSENRYPPKSHDMVCGIDADGIINPVDDGLREGAKLLFEVNSSILWMWGDVGRLQYWISNEDFEQKAWHKAFLLLRSG